MSEEIDDLLGFGASAPSTGDALKLIQSSVKVPVKRKAQKYPRKWIQQAHADYELFSKGIVLQKSPDEIVDKLGPPCLYLFRHMTNEQGEDVVSYGGDRARPLWIGVLKPHNYPEGMFYSPTQDQEKAIYKNRPAKNMPRERHLEDGTPYWVDSYFHKKGREKSNKTRHTKKLNERKKRSRLVGDENEIVISAGLPIDGKMFFNPSDKVTKILRKGDYFETRKVARRTMATSNLASKVPGNAAGLLRGLLSGSSIVQEGDAPLPKKTKNYHQDNMNKKWSSDFTAKRFDGPIPLEDVPVAMLEYIEDQVRAAKAGSRGMCADAMWANFREYSTTKIPAQRLVGNSTGDLLYSYHNFLKKRKLLK